MIRTCYIFFFTWIFILPVSAQSILVTGQITFPEELPGEGLVISVLPDGPVGYTNGQGNFELRLDHMGSHRFLVSGIHIQDFTQDIFIRQDTFIQLRVEEKTIALESVTVMAQADPFGIRQLRSVEEGGIYEGKKSEVINIEQLTANKATNNPRQAFAKVTSLNIWESDYAGLQLDIGGRGLSPKRTSNFNTRQNGYDISADPLGYPESYYTPPFQAIRQIEVVRGAGALQYGSQFGGMINFSLKDGSDTTGIHGENEWTYGAFGLLNSFNSVYGGNERLSYYGYFQYKKGDGWRDNSAFEQWGGYGHVSYQLNPRFKLGLEYTHMHYLSQQAGGLTDEDFLSDPTMSNRSRNWFRVNWNLMALSLSYHLNDRTQFQSKIFKLMAGRSSLGLLETPDEVDPMSNRDLIDGQFDNIGMETRFIYHYGGKGDLKNTFLLGGRIYRGNTQFSQGFGSTGSDARFNPIDTTFLDRRKSNFTFPNTNLAIFTENIIRLSPTFSLIPGIRYEWIDTRSEGSYTQSVRINSFGDFIERNIPDSSHKQRHIVLLGLGASWKTFDRYEIYSNITNNYRAINFTDIQIQTNTQVVDSSIQDESGYAFDLGIRKRDFEHFYIEGGLFYIYYNNRIGEIIDDGLRVRTNIGAAHIIGLELFGEVDILSYLKKESSHKLTAFCNASVNRGVYRNINERALVGMGSGHRIEELPTYHIVTGVQYGYKSWRAALQGSFVGKQYSDAANTEVAYKGVFGPIPAYQVFDFSMSYHLSRHFELSCSINNILDASYFTRRATAYPGPGIIPAQGRSWQLSANYKW